MRACKLFVTGLVLVAFANCGPADTQPAPPPNDTVADPPPPEASHTPVTNNQFVLL